MKCFAILDMKAEVFQRPFFESNEKTAQRAFEIASHDEATLLGQATEDFSLWLVGEFDDQAGVLMPIEPRMVLRGVDLAMSKSRGEFVEPMRLERQVS